MINPKKAGVIDPNPITKEVCIKPAPVTDKLHIVINCCIDPTYMKKVREDNILPIAISFDQFNCLIA
jgi:hypothetical protein